MVRGRDGISHETQAQQSAREASLPRSPQCGEFAALSIAKSRGRSTMAGGFDSNELSREC